MKDFDVCIIGSGSGGGAVAASLAEAGYRVAVLERGPRFDPKAFLRDELEQCRRPRFWPSGDDAPTVQVTLGQDRNWAARPTGAFLQGQLVGGSGVLMSGFFTRMKPDDFRMRAKYGSIEGANIADWPITYDDLEPYYARAEQEVGVSGRVVDSVRTGDGTTRKIPPQLLDRRSTPGFPYPPQKEHPFAAMLDRTAGEMGLTSLPLPRAILTRDEPRLGRKACDYNGYCGSYGCYQNAKGSSLAAFIPRAEATGRCTVIAEAFVTRLVSDEAGKVVGAEFIDKDGATQRVEAAHFVVACRADETSRLLLLSRGPRHRLGLGNNRGLVGRNMVSSAYAAAWAAFRYDKLPHLRSKEPMVNRVIQDFNFLDGRGGLERGGTLNFLLMHPNPIYRATQQALWVDRPEGRPLWGQGLKERLRWFFREVQHLRCEVFQEWLPAPYFFTTLDGKVKDRFGRPVARVYEGIHPKTLRGAAFLRERAAEVLGKMNPEQVWKSPGYGTPSHNLLAGGCRFGTDPAASVLDPMCRVHEVPNLHVADGSFMPTGGGSGPFTFTIYANALRVADGLIRTLGGWKDPQRTPPSTLTR